MALTKIRIRRHNEFSKQGLLHGFKIPPIEIKAPEQKESPIADALVDKLMREAIARKQRELNVAK